MYSLHKNNKHTMYYFVCLTAFQVNVSLHKNGTSAAFVLFDATGRNMTSWFDRTRIINSSWNIHATQRLAVFSMEGYAL